MSITGVGFGFSYLLCRCFLAVRGAKFAGFSGHMHGFGFLFLAHFVAVRDVVTRVLHCPILRSENGLYVMFMRTYAVFLAYLGYGSSDSM